MHFRVGGFLGQKGGFSTKTGGVLVCTTVPSTYLTPSPEPIYFSNYQSMSLSSHLPTNLRTDLFTIPPLALYL